MAAAFLFLLCAIWSWAQGRTVDTIGSQIVIVPVVCVALLPAILLPVKRELRRQQAVLARRLFRDGWQPK